MPSLDEAYVLIAKSFYMCLLILIPVATSFIYLYFCWYMCRERSAQLAVISSSYSKVQLVSLIIVLSCT